MILVKIDAMAPAYVDPPHCVCRSVTVHEPHVPCRPNTRAQRILNFGTSARNRPTLSTLRSSDAPIRSRSGGEDGDVVSFGGSGVLGFGGNGSGQHRVGADG